MDSLERQGHARLARVARLRQIETALDADRATPALEDELEHSAVLADRLGDGGLAREVAVLHLRVALRLGEVERAELLIADLQQRLRQAPDARAKVALDCLSAGMQPTRLREAARTRCLTNAAQAGQLRIAQRARAGIP